MLVVPASVSELPKFRLPSSVPLIVVALAIVPVPESVAPFATVTGTEVPVKLPVKTTFPASTLNKPGEYVLVPVNVQVPVPFL